MSKARIKPVADRTCTSCGCPIKFVRARKTGGVIPLDLRSPCYHADGSRAVDAFVTHYCSCPHASEHSKKNKKTDDREDTGTQPRGSAPG